MKLHYDQERRLRTHTSLRKLYRRIYFKTNEQFHLTQSLSHRKGHEKLKESSSTKAIAFIHSDLHRIMGENWEQY
jgi:hypothetical protein